MKMTVYGLNNQLLVTKMFLCGFILLLSVFIAYAKVVAFPISGFTLFLCCLVLWFTCLCATFVGLHKLLQCKEPITFNFLNKLLGYQEIVKTSKREVKLNQDNLKKLTNDIDKYFISKWYSYITEDNNFSEESKSLIEEVLARLIGVQLQMNNKNVLHCFLNIYIKHLKEFKRSLKRKEKYNVDVKDLYRYSHICSNAASRKPRDYFLQQLTTNLLRHFINSELWNSLPCHILVSVLSRKFTAYILTLLSNPEVLNYFILYHTSSSDVQEELKLNEYGRICIAQYFDVSDSAKESDKSEQNGNIDKEVQVGEEATELDGSSQQKDDNKNNQEHNIVKSDVTLREKKIVPKNEAPVTPTPELIKKSDPVKIHEPKSSTKTWRDSRDLACVSLGQDPLEIYLPSSEKTTPKHVLWEVGIKAEEAKQDSPQIAANIFNEVIHMTSMEGLKSSIKPILSDATERTLHNIKDLQETTVHNALHKIGDFQVIDNPLFDNVRYLHFLPPHTLLHSSVQGNIHGVHLQHKDEAVGVVEGILDFGRAGFRKGLRLTGLQDNVEVARASPVHIANLQNVKKDVKKTKPAKLAKSESQDKMSSADSADSVWLNPLQADSPNFDGQILLEKQIPKESTQGGKNTDFSIPSISTEQPSSGTDSPDPEYEDTADLASSIAKLRSLLQQRSSESSLSTPALSPMPDEYSQRHTESGNTSDIEVSEVDGVMPSFYKFCTKTASGVLSNTINTIKTALPGNNVEPSCMVERWKFKSELVESDVLVRMRKLLAERKEYCTVDKEIDTAYEAIDSIDFFQQSPNLISSLQFDDELDEFELKVPITKTLVDIFCELMADTNSALIQEPTVKVLLLLFGVSFEKNIEQKLENIIEHFANNLFTIPESSNTECLTLELGDFVDVLLNNCSESIKLVVGKDSLKTALTLFISSLQVRQINEDVFLQAIELVAMKLIEECTQTTPPASA